MKRRHWFTALAVAVILVPVLVLAVLVLTFNPNAYAPQIIAAAQKATGRQLTLGGPITLELSLTPTIQAGAVSLSNPPGFADADLLTLQKIEARFALLPLLSHRLDIITLRLENPVFNLQRNAAGAADWVFTPPPPTGTAPAAQSPAPNAASPGYKIALESVEIDNGVLTFRNAAGQPAASLALSRLTGQAASLSAPLNIQAQAQINGIAFNITGTLGPAERFSGIGAGPWPVDLTLASTLGNAAIHGAFTDPAAARGYDVNVNAAIPNLAALAPLLPPGWMHRLPLPPVQNISASARIMDQNSTIPAIDNLSIKAGASDLSAYHPGLQLSALTIGMASLDQPLTLAASGTIHAMPLSLQSRFGPPQALLNPALLPATMPPQGSYPITIQAAAGAATLGLTGAIATPRALAGVALAVNAAIPDLTTLDDLAGMKLPAWKNLALQTTLIDPGGLGLAKAAGLDGLAFTMDNAALGGDASLYFGKQPRLQAAIAFRQINLDALLAGLPPPQSAAPAPAMRAPVAAPPAATPAPLVPDIDFPVALMKDASADILLSADSLMFNHATYTALQGHAVLAGGVLSINPLTGELPGGSVAAAATLDAAASPARESLTLRAPALALAPFLQSLGLADTAQGTIQLALNAAASGNTLLQAAGSVSGQLGLASVNGIIDGQVLDQLFGTALGAALGTGTMPGGGAQGPVAVRCFGLAVNATNGTGTVRALTLDSSRMLLQGGGSIAFGQETLALVLRPQLRIAGDNLGVPVSVSGTWQKPKYGIATMSDIQAASAAAPGLSSSAAARVGGDNSVLGALANAVGLGGGDACPQALSLARLGQPGPPAPPPLTTPAGSAIAPQTGPKNLLNELFGK